MRTIRESTFVQKPAYDMNSYMEEYYAINKFFLSQLGGWPYQRKVLRVLIPSLLTMVQYSVIATEVLLLYDTWGDIDIFVEVIITTIPILASNLKLLNIVVNNGKLRCLLQLMNDHWKLFNSEFEHHTLRYYANIGRKLTNYFGVYMCFFFSYFIIVLTFYLLIPLIPRVLDIIIPLNESRPLAFVYQAEYRVDKEKYYYPIMCHAYISTLIIIIILFTVDTTYIVCVLHACSLFTAIGQRLENITGRTNDKKPNTEKYYYLLKESHGSVGSDYHELITCLRKHQFALEHVQILDSMFTHVTVCLLTMNVLILSVMGIHLINKLDHTGEVIRYVFVTIAVFTHLICMCVPGQLLIDRSTGVFDKAYNSEWYTFSLKTRNLLRILLYRSFIPCTLSAGKLFVMSMTMCSSVMQTAMSYFTAILAMK
ncbi:odorant receptor 49a-like [Pogonomyrmex barbatus]|uniref:Odorant receptor n=1 Tax=Pogonomyrmex barbatus TaxID=144034 RepID=A0A8N1S5P2_9HYME|nr:odorant receptor 49a-like [Pogonomyrmex barbatus]